MDLLTSLTLKARNERILGAAMSPANNLRTLRATNLKTGDNTMSKFRRYNRKGTVLAQRFKMEPPHVAADITIGPFDRDQFELLWPGYVVKETSGGKPRFVAEREFDGKFVYRRISIEMAGWSEFVRRGSTLLRPYIPGEPTEGISLGNLEDAINRGDYPEGAMVAISDNDPDDIWLVPRESFESGYYPEPMEAADA